MASDASFVDYVREQMAGAGAIALRKMFGEYALYCDGKVIALVCDNRLFVKPTTAAAVLLGRYAEGLPFPGAKPWILGDDYLDDAALLARLIRVTADELPAPRLKTNTKKKTKRATRSRR